MNQALQAIAEKYNVTPCRIPGFTSSGFPALDDVTGGIPKGRIVDIHGSEDAGKTALALALSKGNTLFLDAENKLTPSHVRGREGFFIIRPTSLEDALEVCRTAAKGFDTVVIDSIEALPTREELRMGVGWYSEDTKRRERLLSDALPILAHEFLANDCTLIIVNQMRNRQGVIYGRVDFSTGGKALPYYAALRLELRRVEYTKDRNHVTGQVVNIRVMKSKYGAPFREVEATLDYQSGWKGCKVMT